MSLVSRFFLILIVTMLCKTFILPRVPASFLLCQFDSGARRASRFVLDSLVFSRFVALFLVVSRSELARWMYCQGIVQHRVFITLVWRVVVCVRGWGSKVRGYTDAMRKPRFAQKLPTRSLVSSRLLCFASRPTAAAWERKNRKFGSESKCSASQACIVHVGYLHSLTITVSTAVKFKCSENNCWRIFLSVC